MLNANGHKSVLNVGGNNKSIPIPAHYKDWQHDLLDIDEAVQPDVLLDARYLTHLPREMYDAIYCSHNLEHYYRHDAAKVLAGFFHVLKPDGFAEIIVPDIQSVVAHMYQHQMDINDVLYDSAMGPITILDVMYGHGGQIESSGQDFYAHKTGFSPRSLELALMNSGFFAVALQFGKDFEVRALAFKAFPSLTNQELLGLQESVQNEAKT